jgi:subtilisin family serine protease
MYEAWGITQGSSDIIVGIVDSYMDLSHPELSGSRAIYPFSVTKGNTNVAPPRGIDKGIAGHGTLVTSVAVGNANNNAGSSGIAPRCRYIPVSIGEAINTITMVEGILYCMYHGASVINVSCGAQFPPEITSMPLDKQIEFSEQYGKRQEDMWNYVFKLANRRNVTIVWAAGNENCFGAMDTSKRNGNTIRVSAVDRNLKRAEFSNFGNFSNRGIYESTISAPGVDIWGALPNNSYDAWPGTSFSAPIITGVVALLKSENKDLTTTQIIKILQSTGKPVTGSPEIGNLVQVKDALLKAKQTVSSANTEN